VAMLVVKVLAYPFSVALAVAVALAQIGEFSFMVAAVGRQLGVLTDDAMNTVVVVAIISIVINPLLYRARSRIEHWVFRSARARGASRETLEPAAEALSGADQTDEPDKPDKPHRAVIIGYGPSGRTLTRLLQDSGIVPTIVELNMDTVRRLREDGVSAVYGDATHRDTLRSAGVANAGSLILSAANMDRGEEVIRQARELNPSIRVLARTPYLRGGAALRRAGADEVFSGEGEVALALTEAVLRRLGATPEQVERERARAHDELFDLE
jgi:monovalent cation:H+ antiporter-2, CPA2 family